MDFVELPVDGFSSNARKAGLAQALGSPADLLDRAARGIDRAPDTWTGRNVDADMPGVMSAGSK
jgi:hypothetical protein